METPKIVPGTNGESGGTWDRTIDQTKSDVHSAIDKAADSARPAVDQISASAHSAVDKISTAAAQAATVISERAAQLKEVQQQMIADARVRVREKPVTALAIAVGAGFLLRHLLRRTDR